MRTLGAAIAFAVAAFIIYFNAHFTVDANQQVVVTQFGKVVRAHTDPGKYYRLPFIQKTNYIHKGPLLSEIRQIIPTLDKKFIQVDAKVHFKISDSTVYFQTLNNEHLARTRVEDIVEPALRNVIITNEFHQLFPEENFDHELKRKRSNPTIEDKVEEISAPILSEFGITLIAVEALITYPIKES